MPSNVQDLAQMADHAATQITDSHTDWTDVLKTAARLYKYPYREQLMIFVQRPDVTACAGYEVEVWNDKMRRYIRRSRKGIALIDASRDKPRIRYAFDLSDMGGRENSLRPFPLQYRPKHEDTVPAALERSYSISGQNGLLGRAAETLRLYCESAGGKRAVFRRGPKGADGFCQGKVCGKLRADCSAKSLPYQAEHKKEVTAAQLKQLWGYAEAFENATPAERRVIASALMEGVTVYPGYEPEIQFRGGVPE